MEEALVHSFDALFSVHIFAMHQECILFAGTMYDGGFSAAEGLKRRQYLTKSCFPSSLRQSP